jgi:hypothetical protein
LRVLLSPASERADKRGRAIAMRAISDSQPDIARASECASIQHRRIKRRSQRAMRPADEFSQTLVDALRAVYGRHGGLEAVLPAALIPADHAVRQRHAQPLEHPRHAVDHGPDRGIRRRHPD